MAVETVNARYEGFIFDGENSRDYGVYVTDVEVFGTPVRSVEMVQIPGRNGAFALDKGSWENIEVTYKCAMGCETPADFKAGISAFRNMLASRIGYKRLEDEINADEYRMALYKGGMSVPTINKETATFDVVFECQPQRYLKSGETAVSVSSGDTISNPTLYDASPLLEFRAAAAGDISINDDAINIKPEIYGNQTLSNGGASSGREYTQTVLLDFDSTVYRAGDTITVGSITTSAQRIFATDGGAFFDGYQNSVTNGLGLIGCTYANSGARLQYGLAAPVTFTAGTSATHTATATIDIIYEKSDATTVTVHVTTTVSVAYDGDGSITITYTISGENMRIEDSNCALSVGAITVYSTKPVLDGTVYVDLDIGEAYMDAGGAEYISANNAVTIPAKLPVLVPGTNAITYDNTITQFKIVPRWWQL